MSDPCLNEEVAQCNVTWVTLAESDRCDVTTTAQSVFSPCDCLLGNGAGDARLALVTLGKSDPPTILARIKPT